MLFLTTSTFSCSSHEDRDVEVDSPEPEIDFPFYPANVGPDLQRFCFNFSIDMANYAVTSSKSDGNVVVSPFAAAMAFAMSANGVNPDNRTAFTDYLGTSDLASVNYCCAELVRGLPRIDKTTTLNMANSVWVNADMGTAIEIEFASKVLSKYKADIFNENFKANPVATVDSINQWCNKMTRGKASSHFENIDDNALAVMLSAIYFNSSWVFDIFDKNLTKKDLFHGRNGDTDVDMMESSFFTGQYGRDDLFERYVIPVGKENFLLDIIVPVKEMSFEECSEQLIWERWSKLRSDYVSLKLYMPKFSIECTTGLNDMLKATGKAGLCESLDFSMFGSQISGDMAYSQFATFSIDETGGLDTSGDFKFGAGVSGPLKEVTGKIDRPFFFFIHGLNPSACVLFGYISNL